MSLDCVIGPVKSEDFQQLLAIEQENPSPWGEKQLQEELAATGSWHYEARSTGSYRVYLRSDGY